MKHLLLSAILWITFSPNAICQTAVKTYYDSQNSKLKEHYSTNSLGEKHGNYKAYFEDGLLGVDCNYVNGKLDGIYKEYRWGGSKTYLQKQETYKSGVLHGEAKYYGGDDLAIIIRQGHYIDGKEDGIWIFIEEVASGYYFPKGFQHYKGTVTYKSGEIISVSPLFNYYPAGDVYIKQKFNDTKIIEACTYYPSGKIARVINYDDSERPIFDVEYFENADTVALTIFKYSENETEIIYKEWYSNGSLKISKTTVNQIEVSYEGYNEDGSPDQKMQLHEKNKKTKQEEHEKQKQELINQRQNCNEKKTSADDLFLNGNYNQAEAEYKSLITTVKEYNNFNSAKKDTSNYSFLNGIYKHCNQKLSEIESYKTNVELKKNQDTEIISKHDQFISIYLKRETISTTNGLTSEPIYKNSYPLGKHLFEKSESYYNSLVQLRNSETDLLRQIELGKEILNLLNKLLSLSNSDTGELNKQLKKAESNEAIKQILGL